MHGGNIGTLARPLKSLMNKIHDNALAEKIFPKRRHGDPLTDRICGDERAGSFVVNEIGGEFVPRDDVIEVAAPLDARENSIKVGFLFTRTKTPADKRRVADNIINIGREFLPSDAQRIRLMNVGVTFQRKKIQVPMNNLASLNHHLQFRYPQCRLRNRHCKIIYLYPVEIFYRNFYRVD